MEPREGDDSVDRIMLFFANWSRPIVEEWFKLMQWLLVMAVLAFLSKQSEQFVFTILLGLSVIALWCYLMFGYLKLWHEFIWARFHNGYGDSLASLLKRFSFWGVGAVAISLIAGLALELAFLFGTAAARILYRT
ncbi:hypothetical protein C9974_14010 [Marinobacter sp. B9-2]|nr:hypothetical protein C9974_14010 [Marinobacter sp. B9-2]